VGPMDERFFMYFEDVDWCRRFWQAGYRIVYLPQAKIYHYHLRVSKKTGGLADLFINKYTWIHIVSAIKYFLKYKGSLMSSRTT
jgi:N-acetylglucosaminyl-diphospho-decaprenol L-rhamnosyltransferase